MNYAASSINGVTGLQDVQIVEYPKPQTTIEILLEELTGSQTAVFEGTVLESVEKAFSTIKETDGGKAYARIPYEIVLK